jgi:alpha-D-xyloside xylohydrolase
MLLEFPDDPTCAYLDRQYMLGESLLVAPVFTSDGVIEYYVPAGYWTNFFTGAVLEGPSWVRETHDYLSIPLLVRPNSVVAVGRHEDRPDYDYGDGITLQVYDLTDGATMTTAIPSITGDMNMLFEVKREEQTITIARQGVSKLWRVLLVGIKTIASVEGGSADSGPHGVMVAPMRDANYLRIILS